MPTEIKERDVKRDGYTIRALDGQQDVESVLAAVAIQNGKGGIAADARLTVPMLAFLCKRHGRARVIGGAFSLDTDTYIWGDGGCTIEALQAMLCDDPKVEVVIYTEALLKAHAAEFTFNDRWEFDL